MPEADYPACFSRILKNLLKKFSRSSNTIINQLDSIYSNPTQGDRMPGFAPLHLRKTRFGLPEYNIGKSGGIRVIWLLHGSEAFPLLISIYFKGDYRSETDVVALVKKNLKDLLAEM